MKKINSKHNDKGINIKSLKSNVNERLIPLAGVIKKSSVNKHKIEGNCEKLQTEASINVTHSLKNMPTKTNYKDSIVLLKPKKMNENMSCENLSKIKKDQKRPLSLCVKIEEKCAIPLKVDKTIINLNNNSFSGNNRSNYKFKTPIITETCDIQKIEEKTYENSVIDDEFINTHHEELLITEPVKNRKEKIKNCFYDDLEKKLDISLKELKKVDKDSSFHKRKFTIVSSFFEEYFKGGSQREESNLLAKLNNTYIEIIKSLIKENNDLRNSVFEKEKITHKYNNLIKKFNEKCSLLEERNEELNQLKNKLKTIELKDDAQSIEPKDTFKEYSNTNFIEVENPHNEIIKSKKIRDKKDINKSNIDDLEAIYFFDRVDGIRSKSVIEVPKLDLNFAASKPNVQTVHNIENQKKLVKNKTLEIVKHINTSFKHDLIVNNKKTYVPVKNSITLTQNDVFFDSKNIKFSKPVTYSTKSSSSTSIKNEFKKLHNNK